MNASRFVTVGGSVAPVETRRSLRDSVTRTELTRSLSSSPGRWICLGALAAICLPASAASQQPPSWELRRTPAGEVLDFRADGAWRRKARAVSDQLATLRAQRAFVPGDTAAYGVFLPTLSGALSVPALFFRYQDLASGTAFPTAQLEGRLFGAQPPASLPHTVRTYYEEQSNGLLTVQGQAIGWITLDQNEADYTGIAGTCFGNPFGTTNCNGIFSLNASLRRIAALTEVVTKADALTDFGSFDNDGPDGIPNSGDDDGVVDLVAFFHSEMDGACGGANNNHMWAHRSALPGVVTADPRTGGGSIVVRDYVIQSAVGGMTGCLETSPLAIGTTTHEIGHAFGLPDLYDISGASAGIGQWGLMGSGNWSTQFSPSGMSAWSRSELGWLTVIELTATTALVLDPVTTSRTVYLIRPEDPNPRGEYFLLSNRQGLLTDSAMIRVHCALSGNAFPTDCAGGLALWHVDSARIAQGIGINDVNTGVIHGVALVQADGRNDLRSPLGNRGDAGDVWPGTSGQRLFDVNANPAAVRHSDGSWIGFDLRNITQLGLNGVASLDVVRPGPLTLLVDSLHRRHTVLQGDVQLSQDSAAVVLGGLGAESAEWFASKGGGAWLVLTAAGGTGSGTARWVRNPAGLVPGEYVDTVTITATEAIGSPAAIVDTLVVEPSLVLTLLPVARADTVAQGTAADVSDSAEVLLTGVGASTAIWSATHGSGTWLEINSGDGVGTGVVRWTRHVLGLAIGLYVDTIAIDAPGAVGSPAAVIDTLVVVEPLRLIVTPTARTDTVVIGEPGSLDSADVVLSGYGASTADWTATTSQGSWLRLATAEGRGSGVVRWDRNTTNLAAGIYVDTIVVSADGVLDGPSRIVDTLVVLPQLTLTVTPPSRVAAVELGADTLPGDSAVVDIVGSGAATADWSATHGSATWLTLTETSGTGDGVVRWVRDPRGLQEGWYVDTIMVTLTGSPTASSLLLDSLRVVAPDIPVTATVSPATREDTLVAGQNHALRDSAWVTLSGTTAAAESWHAVSETSWIHLESATGVGDGAVTWMIDPASLGPGSYAGHINVTVAQDTAVLTQALTILPPSIVLDDVVNALLRGGALGIAQQRHLDSLGNADGVFNLGDLLALVDRMGLSSADASAVRALERAAVIGERRSRPGRKEERP